MGVRASLASSPARTFPTHLASIQAPSFLVVSLASGPHSHISLPIFCMHELQPLFLGKAAEPPWHSLAYRHRCFVTAPVASLHHRCLLSSLRTLDSLPTHLPVVELQPPTPFPLIFHSRSAAVTAAPLMAGTTTSPSVSLFSLLLSINLSPSPCGDDSQLPRLSPRAPACCLPNVTIDAPFAAGEDHPRTDVTPCSISVAGTQPRNAARCRAKLDAILPCPVRRPFFPLHVRRVAAR
jgi:hypothetical protein